MHFIVKHEKDKKDEKDFPVEEGASKKQKKRVHFNEKMNEWVCLDHLIYHF